MVGFTDVEDNGQEGIELAFNKDLGGKPGSRRVIKDRIGRVVEDIGDQVPPVDGREIQLSIDSKVQFFAYQKLRDAVLANKAKAGSVVVLDCHHRRSAGAGQLPQLCARQAQEPHWRAAAQPRPDGYLRAGLHHEAHHRRPWRWRRAALRRKPLIDTSPGRLHRDRLHHHRHPQLWCC